MIRPACRRKKKGLAGELATLTDVALPLDHNCNNLRYLKEYTDQTPTEIRVTSKRITPKRDIKRPVKEWIQCTNGNAELTWGGKNDNQVMIKAVDKATLQNEKTAPNPCGFEICTKQREFEQHVKNFNPNEIRDPDGTLWKLRFGVLHLRQIHIQSIPLPGKLGVSLRVG